MTILLMSNSGVTKADRSLALVTADFLHDVVVGVYSHSCVPRGTTDEKKST